MSGHAETPASNGTQSGQSTDLGASAFGTLPPGARTVEDVVRAKLAEGVGGLRGSLEAALPTIAFVVVWTVTHQLRRSLAVAAVLVALALALRLVRGSSPRFALSGVFGLAIAAVFALRTGRAQDAFLPGILYSCGLLVVTLLSVASRWPLLGFVVGATSPDPLAWRRHAGVVRLCQRLTLVLAGLYAVRAVVMLPLYLAGQVGWLGVSKVVLGWPLYLLALAAMGAVLLRGSTPLETPLHHPTSELENDPRSQPAT